MADRERRRRRRGGPSPSRGGGRRGRFEDLDDAFEDERPGRRRGGRKRKEAGGFLSTLFGFGGAKRRAKAGRGGRGIDFGAVEDEFDERDDVYDDEPVDAGPGGRRRPREASARDEKKTLVDLCTPVFGYAGCLPRADGEDQPDYLQFRQQVVSSIQQLESQAVAHGIEAQDAKQAAYALALFMDEQVHGSHWDARDRWAQEPLNIILNQDPEGGVNFFKRLDGLRDDQRQVKAIFLLCLAMGFRGKFATEEPRAQAQKIGEVKQKILRGIQSSSMADSEFLFPEAYEPAESVEDEVEAAPRWWTFASAGAVVVALMLWLVLFWVAGFSPDPAVEAVRASADASASAELGDGDDAVPAEGGE